MQFIIRVTGAQYHDFAGPDKEVELKVLDFLRLEMHNEVYLRFGYVSVI
jgi:hypothetical protein